MLRFLRIEHLAVIDALEVEFGPGLNVLTGETGAGKSMLVEAVGLLIGGRASADLIRTGEREATVQAIFETANGEMIVRREITAAGRSRAFINDALVTAAALSERVGPLLELHGQHEHQELLDPLSHLGLLDEFAGLRQIRGGVAVAFRAWRQLQNELDGLQLDERERAARVDLLRFQVAELDRAGLRAGEDEELDRLRHVLGNADKLQRLCGEAYDALYDGEGAALVQLSLVWKRLAELAAVDPVFQPHLAARDVIKSQLEDLAQSLRSYQEGIDASPAKLQEVEDRLALLDRLKRKYGATVADMLVAREALGRQLDSLQHADERRAGLQIETERARGLFLKAAQALAQARRVAAVEFAKKLESLLGELAMARTRLEFRFEASVPESAWTESGIDVAECYLSANVGEDLRPLARIASGGELSRVMLAIRTLAAGAPGTTLIFDEVDAGIGGAVAGVVGKKLKDIGRRYQVLCITHLPQIAARGDLHFQISKAVLQGRTQTRVHELREGVRVDELARMIGGDAASPASRAAAAELLGESERISKGESERSVSTQGTDAAPEKSPRARTPKR